MSPTTFWDKNFGAASSPDCAAQGADILEAQRGWRLPDGAVACTMDPSGPAWNGHVISAGIYFDPKVDAAAALKAAAALLPADAVQVRSEMAANNEALSKIPSGGCLYSVYSSDLLSAAVHTVTPSWGANGDTRLATVVLYTGNADSENGSDKPYTGSVHYALVDITASNTDANVGC